MSVNLEGGLFPGAITPLNADYSIDFPALERYLDWLAGQTPRGIAINVDVSEGPHFFPEEKRAVLETARQVIDGRSLIVAGVSSTFTAAAIKEAQDAQAAGADALQVFPLPAFGAGVLPAELVLNHFEALSNAVDIPMVIVHLGKRIGGPGYSREILEGLGQIKGVAGLKEASWVLDEFRISAEALHGTGVTLLTGNDRLFTESLLNGAVGALIGLGTIGVAEQKQLIDFGREGRFTEMAEVGARLQPLADALFADPVRDVRARIKYALCVAGVLDNDIVRPPLLPISEAEKSAIRTALQFAQLEIMEGVQVA